MGAVHTKYAYTAGASALAGIIIFVFFGPNLGKRNKNEQHLQVKGLPNMGSTCYVSAVLQSLAACKNFRNWLLLCYQIHNPQDENGQPIVCSKSHLFPLVSSLHRACLHVNRQDVKKNDTFNPQINILRILSSMNYRLPRQTEQDAHELFEHIMSALHEESSKMVDKAAIQDYASVIPNYAQEEESNNYLNNIRIPNNNTSTISTVHENGIGSGGGDVNLSDDKNGILLRPQKLSNSENLSSSSSPPSDLQNNIIRLPKQNGISHRLGYYHSTKKFIPMNLNPFFGTTASKLKCLTCLSERRWIIEKYHAFSLHLPPQKISDILTLLDLINNYFKTVIVHEVECNVCTKNNNGVVTKSSFSKRTVVAKFPSSICFQIQRTTWSALGNIKRSDHVTFHEILDLSSVPRLKDLTKCRTVKLHLNGNGNSSVHTQETLNAISKIHKAVLSFRGCQYKLCAVISHSGVADSGHFVTFRRGPIDEDKWFLTSDEDIYEVPFVSVLNSNAYMLFYEHIEDTL